MIKIIDNKKFTIIYLTFTIVISIAQRLFYKSEIEYLTIIHFTYYYTLTIIHYTFYILYF